MSDKDLIYEAIISILDKELKKLHISMPSGISSKGDDAIKSFFLRNLNKPFAEDMCL